MKSKQIATYINFLFVAAYAILITAFSPALSEIAKDFDLDLATSSTVFTFNFIGFTAFIMLGGVLADKYNKKIVIIYSGVGLALSLAGFAFSNSYPVLLIFALFIGGFGGILESMANAMISDINQENSIFYVNIAQVFFGVGALVGPIGTGIALNNGISWRICFFVIGIIFLLTSLLFASIKTVNFKSSTSINLKDIVILFKEKFFILLCISMILYTGSEVGSWGMLSSFLKGSLNFSIYLSSIAVGVFWLSMTVGRFLSGLLLKYFRVEKMIVFFALSSTIATLLASVFTTKNLIWILIVLMGLSFSSIWGFIAGFGGKRYPKYSGTVFALLIGSGGAGGIVIPMLMAFVAQYGNVQFAFMILSLFFASLAAIFMYLAKTTNH